MNTYQINILNYLNGSKIADIKEIWSSVFLHELYT